MSERIRAGQQRGLFDNPVRFFSTEELTAAVQQRLATFDLETPVTRLAAEVLDELGIKPTPRAKELAADAIRRARRGLRPRMDEVTGSDWRAGEDEVREWARAARYAIDEGDALAPDLVAAYNRAHQDRPF